MNLPKITQNYLFLFSFMAVSLLVLGSCNSEKPAKVIPGEEPIIKLAKDLADHDFSIVLHDMDVTEDDINTIYRHKYVSMQLVEDSLIIDSTEWVDVSEQLFQENEKNLGMELVSYHGGEMSTIPKPVGYDWAIGNEKYGEWVVDSTTTEGQAGEKSWRYRHGGGSFLFYYWMFSRRTPMSSYSSYSNSYRGRSAFYGSGKNTYGTNSNYQKAKRSSFYSRKSSSKAWQSHTKRASRSSSRYKGGSSSRRRSGGVGK